MNPTAPEFGSAEHAAQITEGRHPGVVTALAWLAFSHLPLPLQGLSSPIYAAAVDLLYRIPNDSAELTIALNALVGAKDWFVRAGIRSDQGRPGPVPRPAEVVDPPTFGQAKSPVRPDQIIPGGNYGAGQVRPRPIADRPQA